MTHYHVYAARQKPKWRDALTPDGQKIVDLYWDASKFPPRLRKRKRKEPDGITYSASILDTKAAWRRESRPMANVLARQLRPDASLRKVIGCDGGDWCPARQPVENQRWSSPDAPTGGRKRSRS